jgi:hypothetical protein
MSLYIFELMKLHDADYTATHPYVFSPTSEPPTEVDMDSEVVLASPFPVFSIEVDKSPLTVDKDGLGFDVLCVFCKEISFDEYSFIALVNVLGMRTVFEVTKDKVKGFKYGKLLNESEDSSMYTFLKALVHSMLNRLYFGKLGTFNTHGKVKFKDAQNVKKTYKPTNVIYIREKAQNDSITHHSIRPIAHDSPFEVHSHWRRISEDTMGKDRNGNRTVKGATWINTYKKGVGQIVTKIRKVK